MISVGIDIGTFSVKVAEVSSTGKTYEIIRFDEYPLHQDPSKDNEIDILEILRDVSRRYANEQTKFVIGVRQEQVSLRRLFFPFKERHKILKSLPFELDEEIPFSMEDAIFDAKMSRYVGNTADILAISCPKHVIQNILQVANDGQIMPEMVTVDGLAFANLFEAWRESPPQEEETDEESIPAEVTAEVIIDLGHSTSLVTVLRDNTLLDARTINWGGRNIAEAIAQKYSIHYVEALKELKAKAFILTNNDGATRDQIAMSDLVKKSVDDFSHELALTLLDLKSQYNLNYKHVALVGGVSLIRNLGPYITQTIEVPTNRLSRIERHPEINFSANQDNITASLTAIGLALEGIKKPKNPPVNLLREEFARQGQSMKIFMDKWRHTLVVGATAFALLLVWSIMRDSLTETMADEANSALRKHGAEIAGLKGRKSNSRNINKFVRSAKKREKSRQMLENLNGLNSALDVLKSVTSLAPSRKVSKMNVRGFSVNNDIVRIQGEMQKTQNIAAFKKNLESIARKGVKENAPTIKTTKGYRAFNFEFIVNRNSGS